MIEYTIPYFATLLYGAAGVGIFAIILTLVLSTDNKMNRFLIKKFIKGSEKE